MKTHDDFISSGSSYAKVLHPFSRNIYRDFGHDLRHVESTTVSGIKYQCPLKCEGDKIYDDQGNCPQCKIQLMPVGGGHIFY